MTTVYVVANEGDDGGGGFWWYTTALTADQDFQNCLKIGPNDMTLFRFDYDTNQEDPTAITQEIEDRLPELEASAPIKQRVDGKPVRWA